MQINAQRSRNECEGRRYVVPVGGAKPVAVDIFWQRDQDKPEGWCWSAPDISDISDARVNNEGCVTSAEAWNNAKLAIMRYFSSIAVAARKEQARSAEAARKEQARAAKAALRDQALRERDYYIGAHSYGEDCKGFFVVKMLQGQGWRWADAASGSWNGPFGSSRAAYMAARASAK